MGREGRTIKHCGACFSQELVTILDMGEQPLAEAMGSTRTYPLKLVRCLSCSLVQLSYIVPQAEVFPEDHPFTTGNSQANREHFAELAQVVQYLVSPGDLVIDIGCNDGTFLKELSLAAPDVAVLGVEPTGQAARAEARGIPVVRDFFGSRVAQTIGRQYGHAAVITASNVFAHVPDPHDFAAGVGWLLKSDGTFITENHDWDSIRRGLQIDTIYHEHLRYYSVGSLSYLLARNGLNVVHIQRTSQHGGSFRAFASPATSRSLSTYAEDIRDKLHALVQAAVREGTVYGIGAPTRAVPLVQYAGISKFITCICEVSGSDKIGHLMPGGQIPVVDEAALLTDQPEYALLFSWHIAEHIMPKLIERGYKGKFIIPLPEPRVVEATGGTGPY